MFDTSKNILYEDIPDEVYPSNQNIDLLDADMVCFLPIRLTKFLF